MTKRLLWFLALSVFLLGVLAGAGCSKSKSQATAVVNITAPTPAPVPTPTPTPAPTPAPTPTPPSDGLGSFNLSGTCSSIGGSQNRSDLSWLESVGSSLYKVERRVWTTGQWEVQAELGLSSRAYSQTVRNDTDYYYRIIAVRGSETRVSNQVFECSALPMPAPVPAPTPTPA